MQVIGNFESLLKLCRKRGVIITPQKPKRFSEIKTIFFAWDFATKKENQSFVENLIKATFPKGYKIEYSYIWQDKKKGGKVLKLQHVKFSNK